MLLLTPPQGPAVSDGIVDPPTQLATSMMALPARQKGPECCESMKQSLSQRVLLQGGRRRDASFLVTAAVAVCCMWPSAGGWAGGRSGRGAGREGEKMGNTRDGRSRLQEHRTATNLTPIFPSLHFSPIPKYPQSPQRACFQTHPSRIPQRPRRRRVRQSPRVPE